MTGMLKIKQLWPTLILVVLLAGTILLFSRNRYYRHVATANITERPVVSELNLPGRNDAEMRHGSVYFVGNATVVIRYAGFTILTDPNFLHAGDHVHLGYGLKAKRLTNPAIELEQLPPIDLVILSHLHEDHFDKLVQQKMDKSIPIVTTEQAATDLKRLGFKSLYGLNRWESMLIHKGNSHLEVTAMPGKHGPGILNEALPDMNGHRLMFKKPNGQVAYRLYISGDTLVHDALKQIPKEYPNIDLALLHLGGTRVLGITVTMDAKQGVRALQIIAPQQAIPIHYNDYDRFKSPLSDFQKAVKEAGLEGKVRYLKPGETYIFHPVGKIE